jgi:26S proteasome regulatory subunit N5
MTDSTVVDGGRIVKMEVDYSSNCDTKIPECKKLAQEGKLHDALDQLLVLEKLTRTVSQIFILKYITSFHRFVPN